jgi:DNA recombination protein RmuC
MVVVLAIALALLLGAAGAAVAARAVIRRERREAGATQERWMAELAAQRVADREASVELLRSVVAEEQRTVDATVQTLVNVAGDKLQDHARAGAEALDLRKQAVDEQVRAVTGELHQVRELVEALRHQGASHHGELSRALAEAADRHQALSATTADLQRALASPQTRGQWGERMVEDVLRAAGLVEGINYRRQKTLDNGQRPDITFFMPQGLLLNMDVKFPIANYLRFLNATSEVEAKRCRTDFLRDVRQRVKEITTRDYIDPAHTLDCVLLFIPNESVYSFVHEHDAELVDVALRDRVIMCSPFTLFAVLGVVRQAMDHFLLERASDEILRSLGGLTEEWGKFTGSLDKVGRAVETLHRSYGELTGPRRRQFEKRLDQIDAIRERRGLTDGGEAEPDGSADPGGEDRGAIHLLREVTA